MSQKEARRIGLLVGRETDWPAAFIKVINEHHEDISADLIGLDATFMDESCAYDVIIDRVSHQVPYYRTYLKFAALQAVYIINNPFAWSADDKFFGTLMANKLGLRSPRTVVLPNKHVSKEMGPDGFRNLRYPMDWQGIADYVGVPAIFKDIHSGGRLAAYRVHNVDELLQRYDESGTRTMILQEIIESDKHVHCFVIGQERVMSLNYSNKSRKYLSGSLESKSELTQHLNEEALQLTQAYGYDINMVEFVVNDNQLYVINSTNPAPVIDLELMSTEQFNWCVTAIADLAVKRAQDRISLPTPYHFKLA
jgi:glutathione synthase/RimK-type ligase-like ATP-grasp enzyme